MLWWNTVQPAIDPVDGNITTISLAAGVSFAGATQSGYFVNHADQTQQIAFYNIRTGAFIKTKQTHNQHLTTMAARSAGTLNNVVAFGRFYTGAYAGITHCYDMATGKVLWTYGNGGPQATFTYSGFEVPGQYPTFVNAIGGHDSKMASSTLSPQNTLSKHQSTKEQ